MRVLITGGSGLLGSHLRELLPGALCPTRRELDLLDPTRVFARVLDLAPEAIVHCAAITDVDACELQPERAYLANTLATRAIAQAARALGARLIYISTDYVFDGERGNYIEHDEPRPLSVYGRTKLWGEREALAVPGTVVVRTSWLFGPRGRGFLSRFYQMEDVAAEVDRFSKPTYAPHLARAIVKILDMGAPGGIYHITGRDRASPYEFVREAHSLLGKAPPRPLSSLTRPAKRPRDSSLANVAAKHLLGISLPGYREALREFVKWIRSNEQ